VVELEEKSFGIFNLFNFIICCILGFIDGYFGISPESKGRGLGNIYSLAVLIPSIAVSARRMHDIGKSGWFMLIPIYNIILFVTEGVKGDNQYGSDPITDV